MYKCVLVCACVRVCKDVCACKVVTNVIDYLSLNEGRHLFYIFIIFFNVTGSWCQSVLVNKSQMYEQ